MTPIEGRKGVWMQTWSGAQFWPEDPRPEDFVLDDIAAALANQCRYAGHSQFFYSVAEHCVLVARSAPAALKLTALMHDASEAYLVDVPRPVKRALTGYAEIEDRIMRALAVRFGFAWPLPPEVKRLDNAILADERRQVMAFRPESDMDWGATEPELGVRICGWSPATARAEFLRAFSEYVRIGKQ